MSASVKPITASRIGIAALVAAAATLAYVAFLLASFAGLFLGDPAAADAAGTGEQRLASFTDSIKRDTAQIEGRSLFFIPPAPRPPPPPPPPQRDDGPPPPPPPPSSYGGPAIIGVVVDTVWFADGKKLKVGDESGDLKIVSIGEAPYTARIAWKGVEFDVPFLPRQTIVREPARSEAPAPEPDAGKPQPAPEPDAPPAPEPPPKSPPDEGAPPAPPGDSPSPPPQDPPKDPPK